MRISDWSSDVCSSDLAARAVRTRSSRRPRGREAAEAAVVVVGVEELRRWAAAGYDAPRAAVARTGRAHRVLAVVAARLRREQAFAVLERAAVLPVRVRAAALDQGQRVERLRGKPGRIAGASGSRWLGERLMVEIGRASGRERVVQ